MAATKETIGLAHIAAQAAVDVKAGTVLCIDVSDRLVLTELFLILTGSSDRQVRAIVNACEKALYEAGAKRIRREGMDGETHWVLLDFGDLVLHIFREEDKELYALDKLWGDCPVVELDVDLDVSDTAPRSLLSYQGLNGE